MRKLSDAAGVLRLNERKKAGKWLDGFENSFPQLFFSVYYGALDEMSNIRQFGMWLLNHGAFEDVELSRPNDGGILLVVDVNSQTASISFGYLVDVFLNEEDTFRILSAAHPYLLQGNHLKALGVVVRKLSSILRKRSSKARRNPNHYERIAGYKQQGMGDILQRIRSNNQPVDELLETSREQNRGIRN
ncbi:MAG: hypothetical protein AB8F34_03290 [Akkermansiaceae bacterium]